MAQPYRFQYGCAMGPAVTYRDTVREIALADYGFITTKCAAAAGVPAVELRKLAARGSLVHIAYGIYRVPDAPHTPFDQFAEALLRTGSGSYLRGDSVLALFGIADVNPRRIRVITPERTRAKIPAFVEVTVMRGHPHNLTHYRGLRAMTVAEALLDCRGQIERTRLVDATSEARKEGLLSREEHAHVLRALRRKQSPTTSAELRSI